jgi:type I restriction enzyme, S subunit
LLNYVLQPSFIDFVNRQSGGMSSISRKRFREEYFISAEFPEFSIEQQKEISNQIRKRSQILDSLSESFENQQTYLTQLRQAILQEAIEGKLTADWRVKNPVQKGNPDYDARALLATIKAEKQKLMTDGKIKKEKPLAPINPDDVPFALPDGWVWVKTNDICDFITKGTTPAQHEITADGEIPFLKVYNIVNQKIDFSRSQFINSSIHEKFSRSKVFAGDVLMNIVGPPLGKIALVPDDYPEWNINQAIAKFRPLQKSMNKFLYLYLLTGISIKEIPTLGVVGQDNISLEQCRNMLFPLPPLAEQNAIVERVDRLLESVNALEQQVAERKSYAEQLMQVVLKEAFTR